MITAVVGRPGEGKSIYLVQQTMYWLSKGKDVYTNINLKLPVGHRFSPQLHTIRGIDDMLEIRSQIVQGVFNKAGAKIILDELQVYLNSRNWDRLPDDFQLLLQQHRKRGLDIIGATQSIKRADVVFRELIQEFYAIKRLIAFRFPYSKQSFGFFSLVKYDPDSIESSTRSYDRIGLLPTIVFIDPFTFSLYETSQDYVPDNPIGKRVVTEHIIVEKKITEKKLIGTKTYDN